MKDPRTYYDDFSGTYDDARSSGYHAHIDDLESLCVERWLRGRRVLEIGCGTGQILRRVRRFAPDVVGIDLSAGMLQRASDQGFPVSQCSATELPFRDSSFDLVYSFKVLPHIPDLDGALREIVRVLDDRGVALLEFYNPSSLRGLWKKVRWWNVQVGRASHDRQVYTVYHTPAEVRDSLPETLHPVGDFGVVVVTPHPLAHRVPVVGPIVRAAERALASSALARWAGFYIQIAEKHTGAR